MSIGVSIYRNRNGLLLAYLATRFPNIGLWKFIQILFLLDEQFMLRRGFPLTWLDYYAWVKGPVAPEVYDIGRVVYGDFVTVKLDQDNRPIVKPILEVKSLSNANKDNRDYFEDFSFVESVETERVLDQYKEISDEELRNLIQGKDSLWAKTVAKHNIVFEDSVSKTDVPIDFRLLFSEGDKRLKEYEKALKTMRSELEIRQINKDNKIKFRVLTPSEIEDFNNPKYRYGFV